MLPYLDAEHRLWSPSLEIRLDRARACCRQHPVQESRNSSPLGYSEGWRPGSPFGRERRHPPLDRAHF